MDSIQKELHRGTYFGFTEEVLWLTLHHSQAITSNRWEYLAF